LIFAFVTPYTCIGGFVDQNAILHIDGDDFFAAVARVKDSTLRDRPLIIGHLLSHGAVVAGSYETRQAGIQPGLSMNLARRLCPEATMIQIDWDFVLKVSKALLTLLSRYSPLVEPAGVDSAFIDYSGCHRLFGPPVDFAVRLRKEIQEQLRISISIGLAAGKTVSAVACRAAKMGTIETVEHGREHSFLSKCPLQWLPGMDARLVRFFSEMGIGMIGELAKIPIETMEHILGIEGRTLARRARAIEGSRVRPVPFGEAPSAVVTFSEDMIECDVVLPRLAVLASELCGSLRQQRLSARHILTKVKHSDQRIVTLQMPLQPPSNRDPDVFRVVRQCFLKLYKRRVRIRAIEVQAKHLIHCPSELPLGDAAYRLKWDRALLAVDHVRRKHSGNTIVLGSALGGGRLIANV